MQLLLTICFVIFFSDSMGNKGAFITLTGKDMKPKYTTYDAVVSMENDMFLIQSNTCMS